MKRLQDLVAADFPDCDPGKFEEWKRAELSFQRRKPAIFKIFAAITILLFATIPIPLARGVHLVIGALFAISWWLCYAYAILRIFPKSRKVKTLYKNTGIHWKTLWIAMGLIGTKR
jgi:hypothetical protein